MDHPGLTAATKPYCNVTVTEPPNILRHSGPERLSTLKRQRHRRCSVLRPVPRSPETTRYRGYPTPKDLRPLPSVPNLRCPHSRPPGVRNRHRCDGARPSLIAGAFGSLTAGRGHLTGSTVGVGPCACQALTIHRKFLRRGRAIRRTGPERSLVSDPDVFLYTVSGS